MSQTTKSGELITHMEIDSQNIKRQEGNASKIQSERDSIEETEIMDTIQFTEEKQEQVIGLENKPCGNIIPTSEANKAITNQIQKAIELTPAHISLHRMQNEVLCAINEYDRVTLTQQVTMNTDILNTYHHSLTAVQHTVENKITERMEKKIQHTHCNLAIGNLKELLDGIQEENRVLTAANTKLVAHNQHLKTANIDSQREVKHWMQLIIETRMQNQLLNEKIEQLQLGNPVNQSIYTPVHVHGVSRPTTRARSQSPAISVQSQRSNQGTDADEFKKSRYTAEQLLAEAETKVETEIEIEVRNKSINVSKSTPVMNENHLQSTRSDSADSRIYPQAENRGIRLNRHLGAPMSRCPSEGKFFIESQCHDPQHPS